MADVNPVSIPNMEEASVYQSLENGQIKGLHQMLRAPMGREHFVQRYNFSSPTTMFGNTTQLHIPSVDMVVERMQIVFSFSAVTGPTNPRWEPTFTWIGASNCQLQYKSQTVTDISEAQAVAQFYLENPPEELARMQQLTNDINTDEKDAIDAVARDYVLPLQHFGNFMRHAGPLSAYSANSWSVQINLRNLNELLGSSSGDNDPSVTVNNVYLEIMGHRVDGAESNRWAEALAGPGVPINFLDGNTFRTTATDNDTSSNTTISSLEGNICHMFVLQRNKANWDGTAASTKNNLDWVLNDLPSDTISVGTIGQPTKLWGQALPERVARLAYHRGAFVGSNVLYDSVALKTQKARALNIVPISIAESASVDEQQGSSSGSLYVRNDLKFTHAFADQGADVYFDYVVMLHKIALLTHTNVIVQNSQ